MKSNIIDIEVHVCARTEKAVLASGNGDKGDASWFPLSQVEIEPHNNMHRVYVMTLPEWLAQEKGLI